MRGKSRRLVWFVSIDETIEALDWSRFLDIFNAHNERPSSGAVAKHAHFSASTLRFGIRGPEERLCAALERAQRSEDFHRALRFTNRMKGGTSGSVYALT